MWLKAGMPADWDFVTVNRREFWARQRERTLRRAWLLTQWAVLVAFARSRETPQEFVSSDFGDSCRVESGERWWIWRRAYGVWVYCLQILERWAGHLQGTEPRPWWIALPTVREEREASWTHYPRWIDPPHLRDEDESSLDLERSLPSGSADPYHWEA